MATDSTTRFSNRVEDYVKYRPGYPEPIIGLLRDGYGLTTDKLIADVGAGTGISTTLFLHAGYNVIAIEPNAAMREKAEELLGNMPGFTAQDGTAESTGLPSESVDAIVAGQAFHWFDPAKAKHEFLRIARSNSLLVLLWNERKTASPFESAYDALIVKYARDYTQIDHRNTGMDDISAFYAPEPVELHLLPNEQRFDFEGLKGRLLSSSYMPMHEDAGYDAMLVELRGLFDAWAKDGHITIEYDTKVYVGRVQPKLK